MAGLIGRLGSAALLSAAVAAFAGAGTAGGAFAPDAVRPTGKNRAMVTISVQRLGNGTITSAPAGILCGPGPTETRCSADFAVGTNLTLRAVPIVGWAWNYWDGACVGRTTPTCTFRVAGAASALVIFVGVDGFQARFNPKWAQSRLNGTIDFQGVASHEAALQVSLLVRGQPAASVQVPVASPGGNFSGSLRLRNLNILPGSYAVRLGGNVSNRRIPDRDFGTRLPAPREGLVSRAWVTALGSRRPIIRLPGGAIGAEAHFRFSHRPARGARIVATWFQGRIKLGSARKPRGAVISSKVGRAGGLPRGFFYKCVLTVNGVVVKEAGFKTR